MSAPMDGRSTDPRVDAAALLAKVRELTEAAATTVHGRLALADQIRSLFDGAA